jgi:hypothetical protein
MCNDDDLEAQLVALTERLKFGGTQQQCAELREKIAAVREAIQHRERSITFVHDDFIDDE